MRCTSWSSPRGTATRRAGPRSVRRPARPVRMSDVSRTLVPDPYRADAAAAWRIVDASTLAQDLALEADVAIVGTGAGGGVAAEILARRRASVVLVEEGPLRSSGDFRMREAEAYPELYQESAARKTKDKAVNILQGRCVGGGTTVNWTSSVPHAAGHARHSGRRNSASLGSASSDWRRGSRGWSAALRSRPGTCRPTRTTRPSRAAPRNSVSRRDHPRNVTGCWNLGYCGMGCPINAKQSMLVTTIPGALDRGATLVTRAPERMRSRNGDRVTALDVRGHGRPRRPSDRAPRHLRARALRRRRRRASARRRCCSAAGSPDPYGVLGKRTFLHPPWCPPA